MEEVEENPTTERRTWRHTELCEFSCLTKKIDLIQPSQLEWLTSLPWPKEALQDSKSAGAIKSRSFLKRAREQLDADHHGLDKIKKRLIEYLAVLRLRQISLEAEQKKEPEADKENHSPEEGSKNAKALVLTSSESRHSGATDYNQATPEPKQHKKSKDATAKGPILL